MSVYDLLLHIDMKGSPLSKPAVDNLLYNANDCLRSIGSTDQQRSRGLIEHEDCFPWTGALSPLRSSASSDALCGASYIPLVQTLGHLEYALKHAEFRSLREGGSSFAEACPQRPGTRAMVREMLRQTLLAHLPSCTDIEHAARAQGVPPECARLEASVIHVGLDEVFSLGSCPSCSAWIAEHEAHKRQEGPGKQELFLQHTLWVLRIAREIHRELWLDRFGDAELEQQGVREGGSGPGAMPTDPSVHATLASSAVPYPGLRCLMWHDMLPAMSDAQLARLAREGQPEVVVWAYGQVQQQIPESTWSAFQRAGLKVWGASAWRGASQPDAVWTPTALHVSNHVQWHSLARSHPLQGMVMTGWSRFCGAAALCDTAAAGWPSLYACLTALLQGCITESDVQRISARYLHGLPASVWLASTSDAAATLFQTELGLLLSQTTTGVVEAAVDVPMSSTHTVQGVGSASVCLCDSAGPAEGMVAAPGREQLDRLAQQWQAAYLCSSALDSYSRALQVAHSKRRLFCPPYVRAVHILYVIQVLAMYESTRKALQAVGQVVPLIFTSSLSICGDGSAVSLFCGPEGVVAGELLAAKVRPLIQEVEEAVRQLSEYLRCPEKHGLQVYT